jgi:hypothetical protein
MISRTSPRENFTVKVSSRAFCAFRLRVPSRLQPFFPASLLLLFFSRLLQSSTSAQTLSHTPPAFAEWTVVKEKKTMAQRRKKLSP